MSESPQRYRNIREALDDFPPFEWNEGLYAAEILDKPRFRQWQHDFDILLSNGPRDE